MTAPNPFPHFCALPKGLVVDPDCPKCGELVRWKVAQPLGDTPGCVDPGTGVAAPRQGSGVQMRCGRCGCEAVYRLPIEPTSVVSMPGGIL